MNADKDDGAWWDKWMLTHCALFGRSANRDWLLAMSGWKGPFLKSGYTEEELYDASDYLVTHPPKGFLDNHLEAILAHLRSLRTIGSDVDMEEERYPPCDLCNNSGVVTVPHPKSMVGGLWVRRRIARDSRGVYYRCAVRCCCGLGKWQRGREGERPMLTVEEYDLRFPGWQRQLAAVEAEEKLDQLAQGRGGMAHLVDDALERLKRRAHEDGRYHYPKGEEPDEGPSDPSDPGDSDGGSGAAPTE